ncbi:MAG: GntR family transcriptional regulator [Firmicutes bacterium]|nr:GntR family transcriptional regulator [Bacillota bacterium]
MTIKKRIERMRSHNPFLTNTEIAYNIILESILDGHFACGKALNQEALATDLNISRTPVRDALSLLEKEGFVVKERNGHYHVYELELVDCMDFSNFRRCIEGFAAHQAAEYATSTDLKQLRDCFNRLREAAANDNLADFLALDDEFHQLVMITAKNKYISDMYAQHKNKLKFHLRMRVSEEQFQLVCKQHEQILHWIIERNSEKARTAMEKHVSINLKQLVNKQ